MCLAIPHEISEILENNTAIARAGSIYREVRTDLLEDLKIGDTVLVHAGFAIEKVSAEESVELNALWEEIRTLSKENPDGPLF